MSVCSCLSFPGSGPATTNTGASQTDAARLTAQDTNWSSRTISYHRAKLGSRTGIKPALIRFGDEVAAILKRRPQSGPLFPMNLVLRAARNERCAGDFLSIFCIATQRNPTASANTALNAAIALRSEPGCHLKDHRMSTAHQCIGLGNPASQSHGICRALTQGR